MRQIKFDASKNLADTIKDYYKFSTYEDSNNLEYFNGKTDNNIRIIAYKKKNGEYTILFKGYDNIVAEVSKFTSDFTEISTEAAWKDTSSQIGSDEVGVGDFFGPVVVCATYLIKSDMDLVNKYQIKDSKKMNDQKIREIGPEILKMFKHTHLYCNPSKISELEEKSWSMHKIMTNLHNKCHIDLINKYHIDSSIPVYVDQFDTLRVYMNYCKNIVDNPLVFQTKGETYYPSIAVSSVIARYYFLTYWDDMEKVLDHQIPKGASKDVDKVYQLLKKRSDKVDKFVKQHFRNYKEQQ